MTDMTQEQLVELKAELDAGHPVTGTYSVDDHQAADELRAKNRTKIADSVSGSQLMRVTDVDEFALLSIEKRSQWISFCGIAEHNPENNGVMHKMVEHLFGDSSNTANAVITERLVPVSRGVELFGFECTADNVIKARALP